MFDVIKDLKGFFKKYKKNTILALIFLSLQYFATFLKPWLVGNVADSLIKGDLNVRNLIIQMLIFGLSSIITLMVNIVWMLNLSVAHAYIAHDTRNKLMGKILLQFPPFFEKHSTGSLMGIATTDLDYLSTFVDYGTVTIWDGIFYPLALLALMFLISWKLTLIVLVLFPLFVLSIKLIDKRYFPQMEKSQKSFYDLNEKSLEDISSIKVIRAFGVEDNFQNRFNEKVRINGEDEIKAHRFGLIFPPLGNLFINLVSTLSLLLGVYLIQRGELTPGQLITFTMYGSFLTWPAFALADLFLVVEDAKVALKRLKEVFSHEEDIRDVENPLILKNPESFEFKDFSFSYPNSDRKILKDINLKFNKGDTIILVGKTGSGKSTLLKQFLRLYNISEGNIYINGKNIGEYERNSIIDNFSYVPQENFLFSKSIEENIKFFRNISGEKIDEAIRIADFKKDIDEFPKGLKTLTGEKGVSLSGGQRQRIALSRALLKDSEVLILDDVFSAVDTKTEKNIIDNLNEVRKNKTSIIATHRLSVIRNDHYIIVMDDGKIISQGRHDKVFNENSWYRDQYMKQEYEDDQEENN